MKKSLLFIGCAFCASVVGAQTDSTQTRYLFSKPTNVGLYVQPEGGYGQLGGGMTAFGGTSLMLVLNKKFAIGGTMTRSLQQDFSPTSVAPWYMRSSYGGVKLEYSVNPNAPIHLSFPLTIGMATVTADSFSGTNRRGDWWNSATASRNQYVSVVPGVALEANLFRFAKLQLGANYRLGFARTTTAKVPEDSFNGFAVNAGLKIGLFDIRTSKRKPMADPQ